MGKRRLRRVMLIAGILLLWTPVFSRADTGEPEEPGEAERPKNELRIEAAPSTGYGRFAICDSLSRVRYGGLGGAARYRHGALTTKLGGSVSGADQHITDTEGEAQPRSRSHAVVDGVAQVGFDTRYIALSGGVAVISALRSDNDGDSDGGGIAPSAALRLGDDRSLSLKLSVLDSVPTAIALAAAELAYQHHDDLRFGLGARIDAFTLNGMPTARVELPIGPHWMGLSTGAVPSEGAVAWQLQLLFDFQLLAWGLR